MWLSARWERPTSTFMSSKQTLLFRPCFVLKTHPFGQREVRISVYSYFHTFFWKPIQSAGRWHRTVKERQIIYGFWHSWTKLLIQGSLQEQQDTDYFNCKYTSNTYLHVFIENPYRMKESGLWLQYRNTLRRPTQNFMRHSLTLKI